MTSKTPTGTYRGPGRFEANFFRERLMDMAARDLAIDPVAFRRRNLVTKADQPTSSSMGIPLEDISPAECLESLLQVVDVKAFRAEQAAARKEGRYLGLGFAAARWRRGEPRDR